MTEKEYIEREAVKKALYDNTIEMEQSIAYSSNIGVPEEDIECVIDEIPAADVVEVVRCSECKHWGGVTFGFVCRKFSGENTKICMHADGYCSYGERRPENES